MRAHTHPLSMTNAATSSAHTKSRQYSCSQLMLLHGVRMGADMGSNNRNSGGELCLPSIVTVVYEVG